MSLQARDAVVVDYARTAMGRSKNGCFRHTRADEMSATLVNALLAREKGVSNDARNRDIRAVRMQLLLEPNREDAEDGGTYETLSNGRADWEAVIEPTNVVDLFHVEFSIRFSDSQEDQEAYYEETLYLLRPVWSESDERSNLLREKKDTLESSRGFDRF